VNPGKTSKKYKACSKKRPNFCHKNFILQHSKHCPLQSSPLYWRYTVPNVSSVVGMLPGTHFLWWCAVLLSHFPDSPRVQKRNELFNSAPSSTEGALRLLSAPNGRFWQQTAARLIRRTACARVQFSECSSTTNAHSETGQMAVCCQNLPLGVLSSRSAPSVLVGALLKSSVFFEHRCILSAFGKYRGKNNFHIVFVSTVISRFVRGLGSDTLSEKRKSANNSLPPKLYFSIF
jgi:hypothetical protein